VEAGTVATLVASGQIDEARKVLERHLPLASLTARLCEGACRPACLRSDLGGPVNLPLLELHVVRLGRPVKFFPLPGTGKSADLAGAGLSSLVAAYELARKGHRVAVHHLGPPGGALRGRADLPERALGDALETLGRLKVAFREAPDPAALEAALAAAPGPVFAGFDDPALDPAYLGLSASETAGEPLTMASGRDNLFVFAGGGPRPNLAAVSAGKKAAGSIDRLLQGVDPRSARAREMTGPSRLVVDLAGRDPSPEIPAADPAAPTPEEAAAEAGRCLACACLSCLPPCPFLRERPGQHPKKLAREFYNNIITAFGNRSSNKRINSCAECGLCGQICPTGADLGLFVDLCRKDMVSAGHMPVSAHEYALEDQEQANGPEASFWRHQPGTQRSRWLLFPGCQLAASEPELALRLYRHLGGHLGGGVGLWSGCCGAPGRWSGRMGLTGRTMEGALAVWEAAGRPTVIPACPSCRLTLARELPQVPMAGLWEVLSDLPVPEGARPLAGPLLVHDPCAARLDAAGQAAVRRMLARLGQDFEEPKLTGRLTVCCGYGGLADQANPEMGRRYASMRAGEGTAPLAAWCVMCRDRFRGLGRASVHPLELLLPPEGGIRPDAKPPGLSARREGRRALRRLALTALWGETVEESEGMGLSIDIPGSVLAGLEERRILVTDVAMVLEEAAKSGPTFVNQQTGRCLATLRPRQVTFWVEYERRADGSFLVHRAWCHRMTLPNVAGEGAESPASLEGYARTGGRV
jgi:Fe-S oxidoreductase